jgi:adenylate kinase family enzyme
MQRVSVVGTSGSGKSTFAAHLAARLGVPHVELDALHWQPGWIEVNPEVFRDRVRRALDGDAWVVDGNYGAVRDLVWEHADTVIWIDFSLAVTLRRVVWRTLRRVLTREPCCNGNRETLGRAVSRDSIILWALSTHGRRRREYQGAVDALGARGVNVMRLRTPREASQWIRSIEGWVTEARPNNRLRQSARR